MSLKSVCWCCLRTVYPHTSKVDYNNNKVNEKTHCRVSNIVREQVEFIHTIFLAPSFIVLVNGLCQLSFSHWYTLEQYYVSVQMYQIILPIWQHTDRQFLIYHHSMSSHHYQASAVLMLVFSSFCFSLFQLRIQEGRPALPAVQLME